jgi:hypothetical protein
MCCSGPKWKREAVPDHKFDFVDTREFTDNGFFMRLKSVLCFSLMPALMDLSQILMALPPCPQILPRLCRRYLLRRHHDDHQGLVK